MKTISKEYLLLFNAVTDTEESLRQLREKLVAVQQQAEELFLEETDPAKSRKTICPQRPRRRGQLIGAPFRQTVGLPPRQLAASPRKFR